MTGMGSADDASQRDRVRPYAGSPPRTTDWSTWTGWIVFAAVLLLLVGLLQVMLGLVALFDGESYTVESNGLIIDVDYTVLGVMHLLVGVLAGLIGVGLLTGNMVARGAAVVLAGFSAVANLALLPAQPAWSLVVIALDVVVIYAVVVHGGELENPA